MDSKVITIVVLSVALVLSLIWGVTSVNSTNHKLTNTQKVLSSARDCIDSWENIQGTEETDYYGNSMFVIPSENFLTISDECGKV